MLATAEDRPPDWIAAGQALQRLLLTCADAGVAAAIHSQPIEVARQRAAVRAQLAGGGYPQLVFRLGTVIQAEESVRRAPADVLFEDQVPAPGAGTHPPAASSRR